MFANFVNSQSSSGAHAKSLSSMAAMTCRKPPWTEACDSPHRQRYRLTPHRLVLLLLVVECLLWLSERFQWFPFNVSKGWTVLICFGIVGFVLLAILLWLAFARLFRLQFQFSVRSFFVLVLVVAFSYQWFAVEMKEARQQKEAMLALEEFGVATSYRSVFDANAMPRQAAARTDNFAGDVTCQPRGSLPPLPKQLQSLLGVDFFNAIVDVKFNGVKDADAGLDYLKRLNHWQGLNRLEQLDLSRSGVTDIGLEHLEGFCRLKHLYLSETLITDAGLEHLKGLPELQVLTLDGDRISVTGLKHLKGLNQLRQLDLSDTQITDAAVVNVIMKLPQLQELSLDNTRVTDAALKYLRRLHELRKLCVRGTRVRDDEIKVLRRVLPRCEVIH